MIDKKDFTERRKSDRFKVRDGAFAAIKPDNYIVGPIQDINRDGLAFRYLGKSGQIRESIEVDIFFSGMGFYLQNVRSKTISDFRIDKSAANSSVTMRRCAVQFWELTNNQTSQIDSLIQNFTDRRSPKDRRKLPFLQYSGSERRKGVERRKMRF